MLLTWLSRLPPENNPLLDEHVVYLLVLIGLAGVDAEYWIGLGKWCPRSIIGLGSQPNPAKEVLR